jgi:amidase
MSTFITRMDEPGTGPTLAVKDLIDVAGVPTTAGCRAVAEDALPAARDAACLAGARAADARIVGKANLTELAATAEGSNPWFGTPRNPADPDRLPGGSSSGSAAAVGAGEADVAYGTDTGGSVRIPSACCGTTGLKTTFGRIPLDGVWGLGASLDTVGPMGRDVAGVELGMALLEPGFERSGGTATTIGRIPTSGDPAIEAGVDAALHLAGFEVVVLERDIFTAMARPFATIYIAECWEANHHLADTRPDGLGAEVAELIALGPTFLPMLAEARADAERQVREFLQVFDRVELLALPTIPILPPRLDDPGVGSGEFSLALAEHTPPVNLAGLPALAMPVPLLGAAPAVAHLSASLQLVGLAGSEELLMATGARVESALA